MDIIITTILLAWATNFHLTMGATNEVLNKTATAEDLLWNKLFHPSNHDIHVRPVVDNLQTLNVSLSVDLYQLIGIVRFFSTYLKIGIFHCSLRFNYYPTIGHHLGGSADKNFGIKSKFRQFLSTDNFLSVLCFDMSSILFYTSCKAR